MDHARVLVTGSTQGIGLLAAKILAGAGHAVTLHARNEMRAADARAALPAAHGVVIGDLSTLAGAHRVAEEANACGRFDAVIHNAGLGAGDGPRVETTDNLQAIFAVNVLAPYILTALMARPQRLVYLTSGLHRGGSPDLADAQWTKRRWSGWQAYSDSKLFDVALAFAAARLWSGVLSNAVDPGWVPTRMGGRSAPDDLHLGALTQAWLATSDEPAATVTGRCFFHQQERDAHPAAREVGVQDELLGYCESLSRVPFPREPR
jgi:NAD(P)-dependent dehydrogenase (short-subunit alcohol dehydrogenase family)